MASQMKTLALYLEIALKSKDFNIYLGRNVLFHMFIVPLGCKCAEQAERRKMENLDYFKSKFLKSTKISFSWIN